MSKAESMPYNDIKHVLPHFAFRGNYVRCVEITSGNVNNTYQLTYMDGDQEYAYTLQHINTYVFNNPREVMSNIAIVTDHLRNNMIRHNEDPSRRVLEIVRTTDGQHLYDAGANEVWRAYLFISDASALDMVETPEQMEEVGRGFGAFQRNLYDFDAQNLFVSIQDFHNTTKRFYTFVRSVDKNNGGRLHKVRDEVEFMFDHRRMMGEIVRLLDDHVIPLRVTHNDTKSNNVLLDRKTGKSLCVIDLDTVMPGSVLYDYGDAVRFGASTAAEDEPDTGKIALDMGKAAAFTRGFVSETNGFLSRDELVRLPLGAKVITCELAMRFLTDYIDGDLYFKVNAPEHNLTRARAQIALLMDIERKEKELSQMVADLMCQRC